MELKPYPAFLEADASVAPATYLAEIIPFPSTRLAESLLRIEQVIGVEGDIRRGKKPFPYPFPARMPMEVAQAAVSALTKPGDLVLDPMTGSGVVPRAAIALGRRAIGIDIDPLAVIQSRALCASISAKRFEVLATDLFHEASKNPSEKFMSVPSASP